MTGIISPTMKEETVHYSLLVSPALCLKPGFH